MEPRSFVFVVGEGTPRWDDAEATRLLLSDVTPLREGLAAIQDVTVHAGHTAGALSGQPMNAIDPSVLVAIVQDHRQEVSALVLGWLAGRKGRKIKVIRSRDGTSVEVLGAVPTEDEVDRIRRLLENDDSE